MAVRAKKTAWKNVLRIKKGSAVARALGELTSYEKQFLRVLGYVGTDRAMFLITQEQRRLEALKTS